MTTFPENLPRWNQRQKKRQRLQRVSGVVLLAASAGGAAFWGNRLWPARGTGWVVCVLLAAVPLALWLLLDCPRGESSARKNLRFLTWTKQRRAAWCCWR